MRSLLRPIVVSVLLAWPGSLLQGAGRDPAFLTSARCAECHQDAYDAWTDSHHGWAWRSAEPGNVLADFAGTTFEHRGVESRFTARDGRFVVETEGPDGEPTTYEVHSTVGVEPLQQYLIELDGGRLQALDVVWDTEGERWYHLYPDQEIEGDAGLHWTGPYRNWNARCVSCHVTGFVKNYEPRDNVYQSSWSEMGVGCEACHGPGEAHVAWAAAPVSTTLKPFVGVDDRGLTVSLDGTAERELEVCAGCHSRRESLNADSAPPGEPFADHYRLALLRDGLYHADGQIDDEVYVYGSFLQSKMHSRGVTCGDCHESHSAGLVADLDAVCTQCHNPQGREEFPTLKAASYVSPLHHRHRAGTEATSCVSCHMPEKTFMGVDPRRDHSFRVPRPDLTAKLGVPNACNSCHAGRTVEWAREQVEEWFPQGHHLRPHYGEVLHAARQGLDEDSVRGLMDLSLDEGQPAIVRATAAELLRPVASPEVAGPALTLLRDPSPLVRSTALGLFDPAPQAARAKHAGPLTDDPARSVRIAAAQRILDISTAQLPADDRAIVDAAVGEYKTSLAANADFPEVQLNVSRFAEQMRDPQAARRSLETAIILDPKLSEAWLRLARLEVDAGRLADARRLLERGAAEVPDSGALQQFLGRVLERSGDRSAAAEAFARALRLLPEASELRVEYGSLLTHLGRHAEALETLGGIAEGELTGAEALYLSAFNHARLRDMAQARHYARQLSSHHPGHALNQHLESVLAED